MIAIRRADSEQNKSRKASGPSQGKQAMHIKQKVTLPDAPGSFQWTQYAEERLRDRQAIDRPVQLQPGQFRSRKGWRHHVQQRNDRN